MSTKEFKNLLDYTDYLISHGQVPSAIQPIKHLGIAKDHVKFTYYKIHKDLYGSRSIKEVFISFLQAVFIDFSQSPTFETMKAKFSFMPKSYYKDVEVIKSGLVK